MTRSWTTIQPMAPGRGGCRARPARPRILSTTSVELIASGTPTTTAPPGVEARAGCHGRAAIAVTTICAMAPGTATRRDAAQLAERELHAQGEQQQHDAELGELADLLLVARRTPA